jgi:three-Cys-motif partner protein
VRPPVYRGREQTFIKHVILRRYLERVAWNILSWADGFVFVDGFSGPWKSQGARYEDTSFGIAIEELSKVRDGFNEKGKKKRLRCLFVEKGRSAFQKLSAATASADLEAKALPGRFEEQIGEVRRFVGNDFSLTFVDPTGWSFDLQAMAPLLQHRPGEVLVNFMYEHFNRFLDDKRADIRASQVLPFGDPNWRARLTHLMAGGLSREDAVLELFRSQLKAVGGFDYVLSTRIRHRVAEKAHFYLVYGTRHEKGLVEFRNVEKKAMAAEEHCRIEAKQEDRTFRTNQGPLFAALEIDRPKSVEELRQPELERARRWLEGRLASASVLTYRDALRGTLERFAITQPELGDLLLALAGAGKVKLEGMGPKQRKPDKKVLLRSMLAKASRSEALASALT